MAKQNIRVSFDQNEIRSGAKIIAGILLIGFTVTSLLMIIGLWPDQMPPAQSRSQLYAYHLFGVRYIGDQRYSGGVIHLNTIIFLLVAISGFMGSMIHLATSFTNYVGSGKFRRSWTLWYFVKPFTASGVAIIFYMVLKAGLLNFDSGGGVNLFGIVILSALAGLFTDKATLKLEEIFTVLFKPKDDRPDRIDEDTIRIKGFEPKKLAVDGENEILISGEGLNQRPLSVKINDQTITAPDIQPQAISFRFKIPPELKKENSLLLNISDDSGLPLFQGVFDLDVIKENTSPVITTKEEEKAPAEEEEDELADAEEFIKG